MRKDKELSKAVEALSDEEDSEEDDDKEIEGNDVIAGQVPKSHNWQDSDIEVVDLYGNITIVPGREMTREERSIHEAEVEDATSKDPRFYEENTARRKIRYASIIERGKAASMLANQNVLDFSDSWKGLGKLEKKVSAMVVCKVGSYIDDVKADGTPYRRQMGDAEMAALDEEARISGTDEPCACQICKARRKNAFVTAPKTKLRSGKKIGWEKYGQGHTLG